MSAPKPLSFHQAIPIEQIAMTLGVPAIVQDYLDATVLMMA